jgi:GTP cyclohydrolase IA
MTDDQKTALQGLRALIRVIGADPDSEALVGTPERVLRAYLELCRGDDDTAVADILSRTFTVDDVDQMVVVGPVAFVSVCEHHLLPFTGRAWVAYVPHGKQVVGLSKLPRLVQHYARRPQVQERLTQQITGAIDDHLHPVGAACVIQAEHTCMTLRGVRAVGAVMTTSSLTGCFRTDADARAEFLALTRT